MTHFTLPLALSACAPETSLNYVWETDVEKFPPSEILRPCLPPDESICFLDTATGAYNEKCAAAMKSVNENFILQIPEILPEGETYDRFLNVDTAMTIHSHLWQDPKAVTQTDGLQRFGEILFSAGDNRETYPPQENGWHTNFPVFQSVPDFDFYSCYFRESADWRVITQGIYPHESRAYSDFRIRLTASAKLYELSIFTKTANENFVCEVGDPSCFYQWPADGMEESIDAIYENLDRISSPDYYDEIYHGNDALYYP
jgi:hypothetical protein